MQSQKPYGPHLLDAGGQSSEGARRIKQRAPGNRARHCPSDIVGFAWVTELATLPNRDDKIELMCNDREGFKNLTLSEVRFMKPSQGGCLWLALKPCSSTRGSHSWE
ncbi:hypothetical protein [Streptomyces sp. NPDC093225]|uniref:hypothetical protein n=1 Tax=Streptomyces sp. NPDC093225 TaxID=3366034 RepID=UPI003828E434